MSGKDIKPNGSDDGVTSMTSFHVSSSILEDASVSQQQLHQRQHEDPLFDDNDLTSSLLSPPPSSSSPPTTFSSRLPSWNRPLLHQDSLVAVRQLVRRMGNYLAYVTLLTMFVLIPTVSYRALVDRKVDIAALDSAGVMVCGTLIMSLRLVYLHLTHWYMPEVQKYVVRILWMVPIYAVQSWLSLRFHQARIYIDSVRDLYEAYVIASFVYYLIELLGGQEALVMILHQKRGSSLGEHHFPLSLILEPWELGVEFMLQCKHGVLQYVVFKIMAVVLTFIFGSMGIYGEGTFDWRVAYPYLCFMQNFSVMYALYCLVMLYSAINEELRHPVNWRPLGKFLCVKGVVFFTWWQGVVIFYLRAHGIIKNHGSWSSEDVANGLINYCIVIEMIGFAIAHSYTFTYKEYLPGSIPDDLCQEEGENAGEETNLDGSQSTHRGARATYRPPATLHQPMKFKDAFWSSTLPRETIKDIQRLRSGIDSAMHNATSPGSISLRDIQSRTENDGQDSSMPPEQTFV